MSEPRSSEWKIDAKSNWFFADLREIFRHHDLLARFVRKDVILSYKQTLLGPLWVFLQPVLTTLVYVIVFARIANLPTEGIRPVLFYLPGVIIWTFFFECLTANMNIFYHNSQLFSKVYFPRLIVPLSNVISTLIRLSIQLVVFLLIYIIFLIFGGGLSLGFWIFLLPFMVLQAAVFAMGLGLIVSVYTARYRDVENMVQFVLRLFMFATPVFFPLSMVPEKFRIFFLLNPLTTIIETFRAAFFKNIIPPIEYHLISVSIVLIVFTIGIILFKRREQTAMDTI